jgi:hypothetical protein
MSTHTPGPWTADGWSDISTNRDGNPALVARALQRNRDLPSHPIRADEAGANARLIAAAPDLLAGMRELAELLERMAALHPTRDLREVLPDPAGLAVRARAAIAKAEGDK